MFVKGYICGYIHVQQKTRNKPDKKAYNKAELMHVYTNYQGCDKKKTKKTNIPDNSNSLKNLKNN